MRAWDVLDCMHIPVRHVLSLETREGGNRARPGLREQAKS